MSAIERGKKSEDLAVTYLRRVGYKIITRNYRTKIGEIDIIGKDNGFISFIEVRSSRGNSYIPAIETIGNRKQNQIARVALSYIKRYGLKEGSCRFDVVIVEDVNTPSPKIRLIKNAFELSSLYLY